MDAVHHHIARARDCLGFAEGGFAEANRAREASPARADKLEATADRNTALATAHALTAQAMQGVPQDIVVDATEVKD